MNVMYMLLSVYGPVKLWSDSINLRVYLSDYGDLHKFTAIKYGVLSLHNQTDQPVNLWSPSIIRQIYLSNLWSCLYSDGKAHATVNFSYCK